jgi:type II secretion system protein H
MHLCLVAYRRDGATLLEVILSIAIFAIVSGAAALSYSEALSGWRLDSAARQIVMDLKLARARAIARGVNHRVRFVNRSSVYHHERLGDDSTYVTEELVTVLSSGVEVVRCSARDSAITFRPGGHASTFGTVFLRNREGQQRRIVVSIAGRMRIE